MTAALLVLLLVAALVGAIIAAATSGPSRTQPPGVRRGSQPMPPAWAPRPPAAPCPPPRGPSRLRLNQYGEIED